MLTTETITVEEALEELGEQIDSLRDALQDLDEGTEQAASLRDRIDRLSYWRNGLEWHVSEGDWTEETQFTVGAMTAGEEAMMHREIPSGAEDDMEIRVWFVAASVEAAPFVEEDLTETFHNVASLHPAAVKWLEAKANSLSTASDSGNRPSESSPATDSEATSTPEAGSTT